MQKLATGMLLSLGFAFAVTRVHASMLAVLADAISGDLELRPAQLGAVASAFPFVFALAQPVNGVLFDRLGPRRVIVPLLGLASIGALVFAIAENGWILLLGYSLAGLGVSSTLMGSILTLSMRQPRERLSTLTAALLACGGAGQLLTSSPLAILADAVGWRLAIVCVAAMTGLAGAGILLALPDDRHGRRGEGETFLQAFRGYLEVFRLRDFWPVFLLSLFAFAVLFSVRGLWAGPFLGTVYALGAVEIGHVLLVMTLAMIAGTLCYGPLDRVVGSRKRVVLGGAVATIGVLCALAITSGESVWLSASLLVTLGLISTYDAVLLAHSRALFSLHIAGRGMTALNVATFAGAGAVQAATGGLVEWMGSDLQVAPASVYTAVFLFLALLVGIGTVAYSFAQDVTPQE